VVPPVLVPVVAEFVDVDDVELVVGSPDGELVEPVEGSTSVALAPIVVSRQAAAIDGHRSASARIEAMEHPLNVETFKEYTKSPGAHTRVRGAIPRVHAR
jgi:hypothetical protein